MYIPFTENEASFQQHCIILETAFQELVKKIEFSTTPFF